MSMGVDPIKAARWRQLVGESSILGGAGSAMEKMRIGDPDEALLVLELLLFCGCGVARVPASIFSLLLSSCFAFSLVPFFVFATLKSVLLGLRDPFQPLWTDLMPCGFPRWPQVGAQDDAKIKKKH